MKPGINNSWLGNHSMKRVLTSLLFLYIIISGRLSGQLLYTVDSVEIIPQFENYHRMGDIYIGGQPYTGHIDWLKAHGISQVINVRTPGENAKFKKKAFDQELYFTSQGIVYNTIPVGVIVDTFDDEKMDRAAQILSAGEKVLIYCKSGPRARYVLLRYLVHYKEYPFEKAEEIVLSMGSYFPHDLREP